MASFFSFLKNLPVALNLGIGFAIVLALTVGIASVGLRGMAAVEDEMAKTGDADQRAGERASIARLAEVDGAARDDAASGKKAKENLAALAALAQARIQRTDEECASVRADIAEARGLMVPGTIAALLLGIVAAVFTNRLIVPGLARAAAVANRVAEGDLTVEIEVDRKDEIGRVLGALKAMNGRLAEVVGQIGRAHV